MFDDPLLIPAQRGMMPTAKAIQLLDPLSQALSQVRATLSTHRDFDPANARMTASITCTDYLQAAVVMPFVKELRKKAPGIRVAIRNLDPIQLEVQMKRGDVDLALMTPQAAPPDLHTRHLFDERYVLIGRRNHPRLRDGITIDEYVDLEHVVVSLSGGSFVTPVDNVLAELGHIRNVALSAASFLFVPEMVSQSDFVALVPRRLVHDWGDKLKWVDFPLPVEGFAVGMIWHERNHAHAGHRWIREAIIELINVQPSELLSPTAML
jgi:DNA-binding transcriptional LysR family regulator